MGLPESTFKALPYPPSCVSVILARASGISMDLDEVEALHRALGDAGVVMGFGGDCCTNIPALSDPDDSGWHLLIREEVLEGHWTVFMRVLGERGLEWKHEGFLGMRYVSVYRPSYVFTGWVSDTTKR